MCASEIPKHVVKPNHGEYISCSLESGPVCLNLPKSNFAILPFYSAGHGGAGEDHDYH